MKVTCSDRFVLACLMIKNEFVITKKENNEGANDQNRQTSTRRENTLLRITLNISFPGPDVFLKGTFTLSNAMYCGWEWTTR